MRYLIPVFVLFGIFYITDVFAQSSETEVLKNKVDLLEKELDAIKQMLKQQIDKEEQKDREIAQLKEEMGKKVSGGVPKEYDVKPKREEGLGG